MTAEDWFMLVWLASAPIFIMGIGRVMMSVYSIFENWLPFDSVWIPFASIWTGAIGWIGVGVYGLKALGIDS